MIRTFIRGLTAFLLAFGCASSAARAELKPGTQVALSFDAGNGVKLGYLLYIPTDYGADAGKKSPIIIFLHGSGEAGDGTTQLDKVKIHGPPKVAPNMKDFPFIVVSPQNPPRQMWLPTQVKGLTDHILSTLKNADADRVYLTGLSLGGFGTWATATAYPDTYAAIAPICGAGRPATVDRIKHLPIWVVHGDKDPAVPVQRSVEMVEALKAAGAKDVQFTRYPDKAHDVWTVTYDDPKFYAWMLSHSRKKDAEKK